MTHDNTKVCGGLHLSKLAKIRNKRNIVSHQYFPNIND